MQGYWSEFCQQRAFKIEDCLNVGSGTKSRNETIMLQTDLIRKVRRVHDENGEVVVYFPDASWHQSGFS